MAEYLKNFDILGPVPTMYHKGRHNHASVIGGIFSIGTMIILLAYLTYLLVILFQRANFQITHMEVNNMNTSYINWTDTDFGLGVMDKVGQPFKEPDRLYSIIGVYWQQLLTNTTNNIGEEIYEMRPYIIDMEHCSVNKFKYKDLWSKEGVISEGFCPKYGQYMDTKKVYGLLGYTGMTFWIQKCRNSTIKTNCYPDSVIDSNLENSFVLFKFVDFYVDYNSDSPLIPFINSQLRVSSSSVYRRTFLNFRNIEFIDDTSYIYSADPDVYNAYSFAEASESSDMRDLSLTTIPYSFYTLSMNGYSLKSQIHRRYYKIQDLMSDFGGLLEIIIMIGYWLAYFLNRKLYALQLVNKNLPNFSRGNTTTPINNDSALQLGEGSKNNSFQLSRPVCIEIKRKNLNENLNKIKLDYPTFIFPNFCFSKNGKTRKMLARIFDLKKIVVEQLDVSNVIKRLNIIDKLCYIYFGDDKEFLDRFPNPYLINKKDEIVSITEPELLQFQEMCLRNYKRLTDNSR
jgi:hypothetical protein